MSWSKIFVIVGLFALVLTSVRLIWVNYHATPEHPRAVKGVLDLRNWQLPDDQTINLNGDWEFYPSAFIDPTTAGTINSPHQKSYLKVPGSWNTAFPKSRNSMLDYGTYHLKIQLNTLNPLPYGIRIPYIKTASRLYINGGLVGNSGTPSEHYEENKSKIIPYTASFIAKTTEIDIVIQVSNNRSLSSQGGIVQSIKFGSDAAITSEKFFSRDMQLLLCVVLALHGLYAGLLYYLGKRQKVLISFLLLIVCTILSILFDDDRILPSLLQMNYEWASKLAQVAYFGIAYFITDFTIGMFPEYKRNRALQWLLKACIIAGILFLVKPLGFLPVLQYTLFQIAMLPIFIIPFIMIRAIRKGNQDAIFLLIGSVGIILNAGWGIIKNSSSLDLMYYPFDIIFAFLGFASYWFRHFFKNMAQTERVC